MARRSWILLLILLAAGAIAAAAAWRTGLFAPEPAPPAAAIGGAFQLVDSRGRAVDQSLLRGKWTAVFFGFTHCPDVCPTTLQTLIDARQRLGERSEDLQIVFISVDPERDAPAQMAAYLDNFPGVIGLTGSPAQVAAAAKAYKAYYARQGEGPDYLVQHASAVYLMDPEGRFANAVTYGLGPDQAAQVIAGEMAKR